MGMCIYVQLALCLFCMYIASFQPVLPKPDVPFVQKTDFLQIYMHAYGQLYALI